MTEAQIGPRRAERLERQERQRRLLEQAVSRRRRRRILIIGGVVAAVVLAVAALAVPGLLRGQTELTGVQSFVYPTRNHVQEPVTYPQTPPAGGNHAPVWQNCGVYSQPIVNENGVHSLEHGAVWLTYQPDLPPAQVETLRKLVRGQAFVLLSPFPDLPTPIVASAWGRQLQLETADDPRVSEFVRAFRVGPQTPEPGAPCTGGTGQPG